MFKENLLKIIQTNSYEEAIQITDPVFNEAVASEEMAAKAASPLREDLEVASRIRLAEYGALHKVALLLHPGGWSSGTGKC
jgi:hypothetical protein